MKIKNYKKLKNNLYQINFIENESVLLFDSIILKYDLLLKKEITAKELEQLKKENESVACYYKAIAYLTNKNRCKKEIKAYLKKNHYSEKDISKTIEKLEKEKIINEQKYLESYVNDQIHLTNNGPKKIIQKLVDLDFKEEDIKNYLDTFSQEIWVNKLEKLIPKKINTYKKDSILKKKEKVLYAYLMEGYEKEDILSILNTLSIDEDTKIIEKEIKKWYQKLEKKVQEPMLTYQVKGKLKQKGYETGTIEQIIEKIKKEL